jgi:hypothetical protein
MQEQREEVDIKDAKVEVAAEERCWGKRDFMRREFWEPTWDVVILL